MQHLLHGIYVDSVYLASQLDPQQTKCVIGTCVVLYVTVMNVLMNIVVVRHSARQ